MSPATSQASPWLPSVALALAVLPQPAAAIIVGSGNLGTLVAEADAIAVLRVDAIHEPGYFEHLAFTATPLAAIGGGAALDGPLELAVAFPVWPEDLGVPYEEGATVLAFLDRRDGTLEVFNDHRALLPAGSPEHWDGRGGARERVFAILRSAIDRTTDDRHAALLLVALSEVATAGDAGELGVYLDAGPWTRRAAAAALLRLAPTPQHVRLAEAVVAEHLADPPPERDRWLFVDLFRDALEDRFAGPEEAAARARRLLPIYRTLADAPDPLGLDGELVAGLAKGGDESDALRLWAWATREPEGQGGAKGHFDALRLEALEGLCRIFSVPLVRPTVRGFDGNLPPEVVAQERRMREAVRAELEAAGLLAAEAAP